MADKAVDGLYSNRTVFGGQCTISQKNQITASLSVDLGGIHSIHHIRIFYRTDNYQWDKSNGYTSRFLGFFVYISNTSNTYDGYLCFQDTQYTIYNIPDNVTIECVTHGRYVIYYNERLPDVIYPVGYSQNAFSELCELEVYGCPTQGFYGENCNIPCPQNCQEGHCNIVDGTCLGCVPGYKGPRCKEQCNNYKYGLECSQTCGNCSNGESCYHVNGSCTNGCDAGVQGYRCDEKCPAGRYGNNCQDMCSFNCLVLGRCDRQTGECQGGCQMGWKDTRCDKKCNKNKFGVNCGQSCGVCFDKEQCHHINGTCLNGCDRGYQGIYCYEECSLGFHGFGCNETCIKDCFYRSCNAVTGACKVKTASDTQDTNTLPITGGTAAVIVVSLVVVILYFVFRRKNRSGTRKDQNHLEKNSEKLSSEKTAPNKVIYDDIGEKGTYQELEPSTEASDDGRYQKLGSRTEGSDTAKYQELEPMAGVSYNGEYQELGPRTGLSDNGEYQELEQGMEIYVKI